MQSHELLREIFQKCSPKEVAAELGLSISMIYKWAEPPETDAGSGASNPLDRIEALIRCTSDPRLVQWICQRAGGFFINNPRSRRAHPDYLIPATNEIIQEFADLLAVIATAAADNHISPDEAKKIRSRWEDLKTVTECFVQCCEEGNFAPLKQMQSRQSPGLIVAPQLSIIVPVFNEAENVLPMAREVAAAMQQATVSYELVFVDDASTDVTWQKVLEARKGDARVRGLRHVRNSGQSAAVWTGIRGTQSPLIATLDGDLQNDPADLPRMIAELEHADFVCGKRLKRNDTFVRRASSKIARAVRTRALKSDFQDTGCAIRVFKRSTVQDLMPFNGIHRFLPILAHANGAKTLEVPVNHRQRVAGVSKYGVWNRVWRGIYDLIGVHWYLKRRLRSVEYEEL